MRKQKNMDKVAGILFLSDCISGAEKKKFVAFI